MTVGSKRKVKHILHCMIIATFKPNNFSAEQIPDRRTSKVRIVNLVDSKLCFTICKVELLTKLHTLVYELCPFDYNVSTSNMPFIRDSVSKMFEFVYPREIVSTKFDISDNRISFATGEHSAFCFALRRINIGTKGQIVFNCKLFTQD